MIKFRRGVLLSSMVLVAGAAAIMAVAALTSWWVLLALIPLAMAVGCTALMAARGRTPGAPSEVGCGCCAGSGPPVADYGSEARRSERAADAVG